MKKLNEKSYLLLLIGLGCYIVLQIFNAIVAIGLETTTDTEAGYRMGVMIGAVIWSLVALYFILRVLKNKNIEQGQKYIIVLLVVGVLVVLGGLVSIASKQYIGVLSLVSGTCLLWGSIVQRKS